MDWAIEDARDSGPMLWWFSFAAIAAVLLVTVPTVVMRRRTSRAERMLEQEPNLDEIISEFESPTDQ